MTTPPSSPPPPPSRPEGFTPELLEAYAKAHEQKAAEHEALAIDYRRQARELREARGQ